MANESFAIIKFTFEKFVKNCFKRRNINFVENLLLRLYFHSGSYIWKETSFENFNREGNQTLYILISIRYWFQHQ